MSGSSSIEEMVAHEQLCYIPCNSCNIVLAVSVPYSNVMDVVTVRCGHCTNLWSVNMAAAFPYSSLSSSQHQHQHQHPPSAPHFHYHQGGIGNHNLFPAAASSASPTPPPPPAAANKRTSAPPSRNLPYSQPRVANRPPEKRQRVPSAYNQFIKEEIQRIKTNNPDISHREAFSTAAKNWAHFPHIHFGLMLESNKKTAY